jgi:CheY-like chemotaxis protein
VPRDVQSGEGLRVLPAGEDSPGARVDVVAITSGGRKVESVRRNGMSDDASTLAAKRPRIYIVDDEVELIQLFELAIRDWFKEVEIKSFVNGNAVWLAFSEQEPDLLIMDCSHPGMDGHVLLEKLAAIPVHFRILLTSELFNEQLTSLSGKGMRVAYLPKPFGIQQFWRALNEFVGPSDFPEHQKALGQ